MTQSMPRLRRFLIIFAMTPFIAPAMTTIAKAEEYKVKRGDTLGGIARKFRCPEKVIRTENQLRGSKVKIGQKLTIPEDACANIASQTKNDKADGRQKGPGVVKHEVLTGETLAQLAEHYLTTESEIAKLNGARAVKRLRAGQKLRIRTPDPSRAQVKTTYTIQGGDTLVRIAKRFDLAVADLMRMNPKKKPDKLRIGDKLVVFGDARLSRSKAVGRPQNGRLVGGVQMPQGKGYFVRRPPNSWGTGDMIKALQDAFFAVRKKHPRVHDIVVGDLSRKDGGFLPGHKSHQTGLDADIGFYFLGLKPEGPKVALDASHARLDLEANWTLIDFLAGPNEDRSRVDYMFIGYNIQEKLWKYADSIGVPKSRLEWLFQYPRGSRAMRGMIRHEPGHTNHIHIRFKCPRHNDECL